MTQWIKWSECSQKCGNGNKNRTRELKVKEDANYCNVEMIQLLECNTDICESKSFFITQHSAILNIIMKYNRKL